MNSVILEAEQDFDYQAFFNKHSAMTYHDIPSALTLASVKTAYSLDAKVIFTFSHSGSTARLFSRLKPKMPIIALTTNERAYHQLALSWGVTPVLCQDPCATVDEAFQYASQRGLELGVVNCGDLVVVTAGSPLWVPGTSNTILVDSVGDVLVRGSDGFGERVHGVIALVPGMTGGKPYAVRGCIVVLSAFDENLIPILHEAAGVILQNAPDDRCSEPLLLEACRREGKSVITGVDNAFKVLRERQLVTLDPQTAIVYKGVMREKSE
jgi:pyruvate kinase